MKIHGSIYPSKPDRQGLIGFKLKLRYTEDSRVTDEMLFDIVSLFKKHTHNYRRREELGQEFTEHMNAVASEVNAEFLKFIKVKGLRQNFCRVTSTAKEKVIALDFRISQEYVKYKRGMLEIKGTNDQSIKVRDRIYEIKDFLRSLDGSTQEENVKAVLVFLKKDINPREEIKITSLRDYAKQYIQLNSKKFSYHTLSSYNRLVNNLTLFCDIKHMSDEMDLLDRDKQNVFFSKYVDFLLEEIKDKDKVIKKAYENSTVKDEFKMIKSLDSEFEGLMIKVKLSNFVDDLRDSKMQMPFCTYEEVLAIYQATKTIPLTLKQQKTADLFLFQCFTGLRFGELMQVEATNITTTMYGGNSFQSLVYVSDKTGQQNKVPLNRVCLEIIEKWKRTGFDMPIKKDLNTGHYKQYPNCLLPVIAQQQVNASLHSLLAKIEIFNVDEKRVRFKGRQRVEESYKRYDLITTHSARHSYSHYLQASGLDSSRVAQLMNHADSSTTEKHYKHIQHDKLQFEALEFLNKVG